MFNFFVPGIPAPQGSKTRTQWGMREDNPNTKPWRATVTAYAREAMASAPPLDGPCCLFLIFHFPRLKSHFGSGKNSGTLKKMAPKYHATKPDADKLVRAVGDALTGAGVVRDDSQFSHVTATKIYHDQPGVDISVRQMILDQEDSL